MVKEGHVRRAKLYYLRGTSGKASKIRGRVGSTRGKEEVAEEQAVEAVEATESQV